MRYILTFAQCLVEIIRRQCGDNLVSFQKYNRNIEQT